MVSGIVSLTMAWFDLFMPPRCAAEGCRRNGAWFCDRCAERILRPRTTCCARCLDEDADPISRRCARCSGGSTAFDSAFAGGLHEPPLRDLVLALKYRRIRPVAAELAALISIALPPVDHSTVVVPVPSHRRRVRARGIDPARLIARRLAERRGLRLEAKALTRTRDTKPQVLRSLEARQENVLSAFRADEAVRGRHVLLVDDVLTTGATSNECAATLKESGALSVTVAVAARATTAPFRGRHHWPRL